MKRNAYSKEQFIEAVKNSFSIAQVCRILNIKPTGGNYSTIQKLIKEYDVDNSHFTGKAWNVGERFKPFCKRYELKDVLKENFFYSSFKLKNKLLNEGVKERKCECCNLDKWNGKEIPLELHHINGDKSDNRLENLQILCPNCHAQTENYRGSKKSATFPKGENNN